MLNFRDTVAYPVLEQIGATADCERLCAIVQDPQVKIRSGRQSPDTTTFGDLAVLITEQYYDQTGDPDIALDLLDIFFEFFDVPDASHNPQSVRDFQNMQYDTFYHFGEMCLATDFDKRFDKTIADEQSVYEYYHELRAEFHYNFMMMAPELYTKQKAMENYEALVRRFVYPLSLLQLFPCY